MGYPTDIPILGFCSSDSYLDIEVLFITLALLIKKYPTIQLILTGEVKNSVLDLADQTGVRSHLILPGFVPQELLSWCLGSSDIFVMPFPKTIYNVGRWPNKLGIYTSQGRPIVTNAVGDVKEVFEKYSIGLTADYTAEDFADKICILLDDPYLAQTLGANALSFAKTENNWKTLITDLESFYYRIITEYQEVPSR
jgi:glycosyltransferase involved in cell wall biosynthesis